MVAQYLRIVVNLACFVALVSRLPQNKSDLINTLRLWLGLVFDIFIEIRLLALGTGLVSVIILDNILISNNNDSAVSV